MATPVLVEGVKEPGSISAGRSGVGRRETPGWHARLQKAYGQALGYAKSFAEPPPFVVVCDLGYCFDLYASFDRSGVYRPFPAAQQSRLFLEDLGQHLRDLEAAGHQPELVAKFLMRCTSRCSPRTSRSSRPRSSRTASRTTG